MSERSWFYAANGQQQGPFPEAQFRDLVTRGTIRSDTLVWTEGMSGWQRAGDIPGLVSGGAPPTIPQSGGPVTSTGDDGGGALSIDFGILGFHLAQFGARLELSAHHPGAVGAVDVLPMGRFLPACSAATKPCLHRPGG